MLLKKQTNNKQIQRHLIKLRVILCNSHRKHAGTKAPHTATDSGEPPLVFMCVDQEHKVDFSRLVFAGGATPAPGGFIVPWLVTARAACWTPPRLSSLLHVINLTSLPPPPPLQLLPAPLGRSGVWSSTLLGLLPSEDDALDEDLMCILKVDT